MNGILRNWESLCDIRPDCHHHFDASGTSNAMFDELAERSLMSPLAGTKHTYVRLAIIIYCQILALFFQTSNFSKKKTRTSEMLDVDNISARCYFRLNQAGLNTCNLTPKPGSKKFKTSRNVIRYII